jgi:hypothetical protein
MSKITIQTGRGGQIIFANEKGNTSIRLNQSRAEVTQQGFVKLSNRVFYVKGSKEELQALGWNKDTQLTGNLVVQESLEPFNKSNPDYDFKVVPGTGVICTVDGEPIYRRTLWDPTGNVTDTFIAHDNKEEIMAALAQRDSNSAIIPASTEEAFESSNQTDLIETIAEVDNDDHEDFVDEPAESIHEGTAVEDLEEVEIDDTFEL